MLRLKLNRFMMTLMLMLSCGIAQAALEPALPRDVQDYIEDRAGCSHLAGEDYSDPGRAKMMAQELRECGLGDLNGVPVSTAPVTTIDRVEKRLRKKYRKHPKILQAIDEARLPLEDLGTAPEGDKELRHPRYGSA